MSGLSPSAHERARHLVRWQRRPWQRIEALDAGAGDLISRSSGGELAFAAGSGLDASEEAAVASALETYNSCVLPARLSSRTAVPEGESRDGYEPALGFHTYWWGWIVALDRDALQALYAQLDGGAGVAALAGGIQSAAEGVAGPLAAAIAAGLVAVGRDTLEAIDGMGGHRGVYWWGAWAPLPFLASTAQLPTGPRY